MTKSEKRERSDPHAAIFPKLETKIDDCDVVGNSDEKRLLYCLRVCADEKPQLAILNEIGGYSGL
jgi:hypothetical protein